MKGLFKSFSSSDVLAVVERERRSGLLRLKHSDRSVDLWLRHGVVVRVESSTRARAERLGAMLVRAEKLLQDDLDTAMSEQRREPRLLGAILVAKGRMTPPLLSRFLKLQALDTVYGVFQWRDGSFELSEPEIPPSDGLADLGLALGAIKEEAARRAREWPRIRQLIPSLESTFRVMQGLPVPQAAVPGSLEDDLVFDGLSEAFGEQSHISRPPLLPMGEAERKVFALVEPGVDVRHLVDRSELGEFGTCEALSMLVRGGYLVPVEPALELDL